MKRFLFLGLSCVLLGAGCATTSTTGQAKPWQNAQQVDRTGVALVTGAASNNGPKLTITDPSTGRELTTVLPQMFIDSHGVFTTNHPGESIHFQVAVGGTIDHDRELFRALPRLSLFDDGSLGAWKLFAAYEANSTRWVIRAVLPDPVVPDKGYHVIECLAIPHSEVDFWNGCRSAIENATVEQSQVNHLTP